MAITEATLEDLKLNKQNKISGKFHSACERSTDRYEGKGKGKEANVPYGGKKGTSVRAREAVGMGGARRAGGREVACDEAEASRRDTRSSPGRDARSRKGSERERTEGGREAKKEGKIGCGTLLKRGLCPNTLNNTVFAPTH